VGKSLAYLIPSILFAVARAQEGDHLHPHHQFAGAIDPKRPADAGPNSAGEIPFHHAQRPAQLSLHPAPEQGPPARRAPFHLAGHAGVAAHF
jgi:hypothetical protein